MNKQCPFCPEHVKKALFAETEHFMAVYNIAPIVPGHTLIVPKAHLKHYLEIKEEHLLEFALFKRKVIKILQKAFNTDSFNFTLQEGIYAGQTIEHLHVHVIPRKENDLPHPGDWYPVIEQKNQELVDSLNRIKLTEKQMEIITSNLKKTGAFIG